VQLLRKSLSQDTGPGAAIWRRFGLAKGDVLALGIVAVGFWLRLASIRHYWNNADEGIYYQIAHAPWAIANPIIVANAHPPLYYYLLRAIGTVSDDFVWLRVPALVFGTLAIAALYRLGTRLGGTLCGLAAAAMLALSPGAIELSQVARPYALQLFLLIGATGSLLRYCESRDSRALVGYSFWMLAAVFTHYSSFLVLTGFGVTLVGALIFRQVGVRDLRDLAIAHAPVVLACVVLYSFHLEPVLLDSGMRREALGTWLGEYFVSDPIELWRNFLDVFVYLAGTPLAGVGAIVFLVSLGLCLRDRRTASASVCLSVVGVAAAASAVSVYPFGGTRHSAYLVPFLALVIGMAAAVVLSKGRRVVVPVALLVALTAVAREPVSRAIGVTQRAPVEQPEFEITRAEVDTLRRSFESVSSTPGIVFMDLSTAYTLLPLIRESAKESEWVLTADQRQLAWGARQVVVIPQWYMAVGDQQINARNHLWSSIRHARERPELAEQLAHGAYVVSAEGMAIPTSIRGLSNGRDERRAVLSGLSRTSHLSVFRLDVAEYQQQLARQVRKRSSTRGTPAVDGAEEPLEVEHVSIAN
jgi:hypothetical protein